MKIRWFRTRAITRRYHWMDNTVATNITRMLKPRYCQPVIITGSSLSVKLWRLLSHWQAHRAARCAMPKAFSMLWRTYIRQSARHLPCYVRCAHLWRGRCCYCCFHIFLIFYRVYNISRPSRSRTPCHVSTVRAVCCGYPHGLPTAKTNKYDSIKY